MTMFEALTCMSQTVLRMRGVNAVHNPPTLVQIAECVGECAALLNANHNEEHKAVKEICLRYGVKFSETSYAQANANGP